MTDKKQNAKITYDWTKHGASNMNNGQNNGANITANGILREIKIVFKQYGESYNCW